MRKIILFCAAATLAACSGSKPAQEVVQTPEAAAIGTFNVAMADGSKRLSILTADHNYTDSVEGQVVEWGTWAIEDGKVCFAPKTEDVKAMCITLGKPAEDRTLTVTFEDGTQLKATKIS